MLEIKVYDNTFGICAECFNSETLNNIIDVINKCFLDYVIDKSIIIVKGDTNNLYRALYLLSSYYNILLD